MATYRKKFYVSATVEAAQWRGYETGPHDLGVLRGGTPSQERGWIKTKDGLGVIVLPGDWIITDGLGRVSLCVQELFAMEYEQVTSTTKE